MEDIRYDISQLFQLAFGHNSPVYMPYPLGKSSGNGIVFTGVKHKTNEQLKPLSWLGTPIVAPVTFKKGTYNQYQPDGTITTITPEDFTLPPATMVEFRRQKNITKTNVLGDNGTVKEVFGFDDWKIRIRGLCLNEPDNPATQQIAKILAWENLADSIGVGGNLFKDKGINAMAIQSIVVKQTQGTPDTILFIIEAISDQILELQL